MQNEDNAKKLFTEFPPVSTSKWMERVKADYKTDNPISKINWKTGEGFDIKGIFREEDTLNLDYLNSLPGDFPFARGTKSSNDWIVNGIIDTNNSKEANKIAINAIKRGASSIEFNFESITSLESLSILFKEIKLKDIQIIINNSTNWDSTLDLIIEYISENKIDKSELSFIFNADFFEQKLTRGEYSKTLDASISFAKRAIKEFPSAKALSIKGDIYHNSGATVVSELAYTIASSIEHIQILIEEGINLRDLLKSMSFRMAIGSSYFIEIAKFRALRYLYAKAIEAYDSSLKNEAKAYIIAQSSKWNKSIYDPYVNMLRTTTETMSAAIAGVDVISVNNFDNTYDNDSIFARRISQNQQIVIKEEAHFDKVVDAAGGSYYIENLTDTLINDVWKLFLNIENDGGYKKYMEAGKIQSDIEQSAENKLLNVATRRLNVLGTNQFANQGEFMIDDIKKDLIDNNSGLKMRRASEEFDALRMETEKNEKINGKRPIIQLISFGNMAMRKARAGFISNFFACAGYEIKEEEDCANANDAVNLIKKADLSILCSSDEEYLDFTAEINSILEGDIAKYEFLIAGNPKNTDELKNNGVNDFIHVRTNVLECLKSYNNKFFN
ncbi:MAG: hypothetical protein KAG84_05035 [Bacteroidales bacterium]|nr:hypothetical protein [Bacteroidales bacterium]